MIEESLRVRIEGYLLHRLILHPEEATDDGGVEAMFYHGQGDFAERYTEVLHPLTQRGIRCTITELPGHGHSPGRRGHCGNVALLDAVIKNTLETFEGRPYGVLGHSMGGLLAARHLVLAGQGELPKPSFAWLSSPLLKPGNGRSALFVKMVNWLAPIMPSLTVSTGVTPAMCRVQQEQKDLAEEPDEEPAAKHQLWHSRVSVGWGAELLKFEQLVRAYGQSIPSDIPLIYTQGGSDPICPSSLAREMFEKLPNHDKQYHEFEGLLHEPFRGGGSEELFTALEIWLKALVVR